MARLILEPEWWDHARMLKAAGLRRKTIARRCNKSVNTIDYVLVPTVRASQNSDLQKEYRKNKNKQYYYKRDSKRDQLRRKARALFRANGGNLRKIYEELGCL